MDNPDYYSTQFLSGHGDFAQKLNTLGLTENSRCECGEEETSEHVLKYCIRYKMERGEIMEEIHRRGRTDLKEEWLVEDQKIYIKFTSFCRRVLKKKEEERLKKQKREKEEDRRREEDDDGEQ